jgi:hypothetical protein
MAAAPIIGVALSGIGTVAGIASQNSQAAAGRAQARAQLEAAESKYRLDRQRFDYTQNAAEQQYLKESLVMQEQARMARVQLEQAQVQEQLRQTQSQAQREQASAGMEQQVQQLLAAGSQARTAGAIESGEQLLGLIGALGQTREGRLSLVQRLTDAMSQSSIQDNRIDLQDIANYQQAIDAGNTATRVAEFQGQSADTQADISSRYAQLVDEYLGTTENINREMNEFMLERQPNLLRLQEERNQAALDAARYANAAESSFGRTTSLMNLQNNRTAINASVPGGGAGVASIFNTLGQVVPQVASGWDQLQSAFGTRSSSSYFNSATPGSRAMKTHTPMGNQPYIGDVQPKPSPVDVLGARLGNRYGR